MKTTKQRHAFTTTAANRSGFLEEEGVALSVLNRLCQKRSLPFTFSDLVALLPPSPAFSLSYLNTFPILTPFLSARKKQGLFNLGT